MVNPKVEDYLKSIYRLQDGNDPVSSSTIASAMGVKPPTVTTMLQRMDDEGLVHYESYRGARVTERGEKHALKVLRNHRLIELFLTERFGYDWSDVHDEADVLEHYISEKLDERIDAALGSPTVDPHGEPIPSAELEIRQCGTQRSLAERQRGKIGVVSKVRESSSDVLAYLSRADVSLGTVLRVVEIAPFGMITVEVRSTAEQLPLPAEIAAKIYVSRPAEATEHESGQFNEAK